MIWISDEKLLPLPSPSQDRDSEVSGPYEITEKWLHSQVGNQCIHRHAHTDMHLEHRHALRQRDKQSKHTTIEQFCLSSRLRILFFLLLVSILPNTCSGACVTHVPNLARTRNLSHVILVQPLAVTDILSFILVPVLRTGFAKN